VHGQGKDRDAGRLAPGDKVLSPEAAGRFLKGKGQSNGAAHVAARIAVARRRTNMASKTRAGDNSELAEF